MKYQNDKRIVLPWIKGQNIKKINICININLCVSPSVVEQKKDWNICSLKF